MLMPKLDFTSRRGGGGYMKVTGVLSCGRLQFYPLKMRREVIDHGWNYARVLFLHRLVLFSLYSSLGVSYRASEFSTICLCFVRSARVTFSRFFVSWPFASLPSIARQQQLARRVLIISKNV